MIFDRHANLKYKYGNRHFWARGYYADTVGRNKKQIEEYIKHQLEEDQIADAIRYAENLRKTYKTALYIKPKKLGKFLNKLEEQGFDGFQVFGRDEEVRMFGK